MTMTSFPQGVFWPFPDRRWGFAAGGTLDATGEKAAAIGRVYWQGRAASKTIDTTGSSYIGILTGGTAVWDDAASTIEIGIQGVNTSGPVAQPDGSFSVKAAYTGATNTTPPLTDTNSFCKAVPTTGTVTLAHGDLISVVVDVTNRGGSDALSIAAMQLLGNAFFPVTNAFASAAWGATGVGNTPQVVFCASDGTLGFLDGAYPVGLHNDTSWTDATNPDERGLIFQVPFDCKVDALYLMMRSTDATSDFALSLYSTPEATPAIMNAGAATIAVDAAQAGATGAVNTGIWNLASEVSLTKNTDYCVAVKATNGTVRLGHVTLGDAAHRALWPAGTTVRSVNRNNGAGDFANSSTTLLYNVGVRISAVDDGAGTGSGGGLIRHPGMAGGING